MVGVTSVPIFSSNGRRSGGRPHNMLPLGRYSFLVNNEPNFVGSATVMAS